MKTKTIVAAVIGVGALLSNATFAAVKEIQFYSEGVLCYGKLFLPNAHSETSKAPSVVLAPGRGQTSASLDALGNALAANGIAALSIDYRGFGKSGGHLYFGEPVRYDDRLRFSQTTTKMIVRRKRIEPSLQLTDIRNAMTYLQGEPGLDRARIGVWGSDLSADHAVVVAAIDARVKTVVAQNPALHGQDVPRKAFAPTRDQQASMIKLARTGSAPTSAADARNAEESKLALAEYHPYWYLDQIAQTTAVRFVVSTQSAQIDAATKVLKGPSDVATAAGPLSASGVPSEPAVAAAVEWFAKNL